MTWAAIVNKKGDLRFVLNVEDEDLTNWNVLETPEDFDPFDGRWAVKDGRIVPDVVAMEEENWVALRDERNARLRDTDWTQLADVPRGVKAAYKQYRKALRDLPAAIQDPQDPDWPEEPQV